MFSEPLNNVAARSLIRKLVSSGDFVFREPHMSERMTERNVSRMDVLNVLRGGVVKFSELEKGEWRYRVWTASFSVTVAFPEEDLLAVVTCWRNER